MTKIKVDELVIDGVTYVPKYSLEEQGKEIAELKEQVQIYQIASDSFADDADKLDEKLRQKTNDTLELVQALKDIRQGKINFADLDLLIKKYNL